MGGYLKSKDIAMMSLIGKIALSMHFSMHWMEMKKASICWKPCYS
jgi:hypothetical protein